MCMLQYYAIVVKVEEGWAWVLIRPEACNIVCAPPHLPKELCHCATEGSTIQLKVKDPIGVQPGDHVLIHQIPKVGLGTILKALIPSSLGAFGFCVLERLLSYLALGFGIIIGVLLLIRDVSHKRVEPPSIVEVVEQRGNSSDQNHRRGKDGEYGDG